MIIRVVVRGADGKPVEGLRKEDFRVFDRGKEQSISQFEVEAPLPLSTVRAPGQTAPPPPALVVPNNFVALYFDDLNTSDVDKSLSSNSRHVFANPTVNRQQTIHMLERASGETLSELRCWLYLVVVQNGPIHFAVNVEVEFVALSPPVVDKRIEPLTFSELSASI